MSEPKPRFKVADIAIDEDGTLWLGYVGTHPDQGGPTYRYGSVGLQDAQALAGYLKAVFPKEYPTWLEEVKKRVTKPKSS